MPERAKGEKIMKEGNETGSLHGQQEEHFKLNRHGRPHLGDGI